MKSLYKNKDILNNIKDLITVLDRAFGCIDILREHIQILEWPHLERLLDEVYNNVISLKRSLQGEFHDA